MARYLRVSVKNADWSASMIRKLGLPRVMKSLLLVIAFIGTSGAFVFAAPEISGMNGSTYNGGSIIITGYGFGSGPNVLLFDDFEKGANGNNISIGPGSAQVGQWDGASGSGGAPRYSNANKISGSLAFNANAASGTQPAYTYIPGGTRKVFVSSWSLIPEGDNFPGEGGLVNWKRIWVTGTNTNDDDQTFPSFVPGSNVYGTRALVTGNNTQYNRDIALNLLKGRWMRIWFYIDGGTNNNDGVCQIYEMTTQGVQTRTNDIGINALYSGGIYERVIINGYTRITNNCHPFFDDVYIAYGDNARARVEIGNNPVYTNCTNLTMATPETWTNNRISAKVWQGRFKPSETAYLFVIDSKGDFSPGYQIKFGSLGDTNDTTPPNAPSGLGAEIYQ